MPVIYFANTTCINRSFYFCHFVGLKFQKFLAYVAETLLGHAFGNVDNKYLIKWNLKNALLCSVFADLVTFLYEIFLERSGCSIREYFCVYVLSEVECTSEYRLCG